MTTAEQKAVWDFDTELANLLDRAVNDAIRWTDPDGQLLPGLAIAKVKKMLYQALKEWTEWAESAADHYWEEDEEEAE